MRTSIILLAALLVSSGARAAGERTAAGPRAAGMGFASVTLADGWSPANNPAASAFTDRITLAIGGYNRFLLKELSSEQFSLSVPAGSGAFGLCATGTGFSSYREVNAEVTYGRRFGKEFAAGIGIGILQIRQSDDYGGTTRPVCSAGLLWLASRELTLGLQLLNPVPVKLSQSGRETLPPTLCAGLSWRFVPAFQVIAEVEKDLADKPVLRIGAEYAAGKAACIRAGFGTGPVLFSFGCGFTVGRLTIDAAGWYHQLLGFSPSASLTFTFGKLNKG